MTGAAAGIVFWRRARKGIQDPEEGLDSESDLVTFMNPLYEEKKVNVESLVAGDFGLD